MTLLTFISIDICHKIPLQRLFRCNWHKGGKGSQRRWPVAGLARKRIIKHNFVFVLFSHEKQLMKRVDLFSYPPPAKVFFSSKKWKIENSVGGMFPALDFFLSFFFWARLPE